MAASTLTDTITSACLHFKAQFEDNIFAKSALLTALWKNKWTTDGGDYLQIPVRWSKGTTTSRRTQSAEFTFAEVDTVKTPALDWVFYQSTAQIPFEKRKMAYGKHQVLNLLKIELTRMEREMHEYLAADVLGNGATNTPAGVTGLTAICDTDNTYAGFDRTALDSTHPWMGHTAVQASLTDDELSEYLDVINTRGFKCNGIWTTPAVKTRMRAAWGVAVQRFVGGGKVSIGLTDFDFQGIPVHSDELIPTDYVYLLCSETLKFAVPDGSDPFEIETFENESAFKGVRLRVAPMLQLMCTAPYHNYLLTGVAACAA